MAHDLAHYLVHGLVRRVAGSFLQVEMGLPCCPSSISKGAGWAWGMEGASAVVGAVVDILLAWQLGKHRVGTPGSCPNKR